MKFSVMTPPNTTRGYLAEPIDSCFWTSSAMASWERGLCKWKMAAYRAKIPIKAQATLQYFRALRNQSGSAATETHNAPLRRYFRAYGTGALQRVKVCPRQDTRLYGRCAFLLGGGIGLYSALKLSLQQHFAEEQLSHVSSSFTTVMLSVFMLY